MKNPLTLLALQVSLVVLGCMPPSVAPVGEQGAALVLRVETVEVAPTRADGTTWDGDVPDKDDPICGLVGAAGKVLGPVGAAAGSAVEAICKTDSQTQKERHPTDPDLAVMLYASAGGEVYTTHTEVDALTAVFGDEFVVPTEGIPSEGMLLTVVDRDGSGFETIGGTLRVTREQLLSASRSHRLLDFGKPENPIRKLEVKVTDAAAAPEVLSATMDAREGFTRVPRKLRAGEVVEVAAQGRYTVGTWSCTDVIGPSGYPEGCTEYNYGNEPFASARHGAAIALIGDRSMRQGFVVGDCGSAVVRLAGPLKLGVNDHDFANNKGRIDFTVTVRPTTTEEWRTQQAAPCAR